MLHLGEAKYSCFVYTDANAAIKQTPAVDHNSSSKAALCLPQQLSLISIIKNLWPYLGKGGLTKIAL